MLLAGESSSSDPISPSGPTSTNSPKHSNFPGAKLKTGKVFVYFFVSFYVLEYKIYGNSISRMVYRAHEQKLI